MCGIVGFAFIYNNIISPDNLRNMVSSIRHRGPDNEDIFHDGFVGLGHARLAIIDTSSDGNQPMTTSDDLLTIVFNGEIYNFQELRNDLKQQGYIFRTRTDTEVLLHGYRAYGCEIFSRLNGVFAIAIWDKKLKSLILGRDHFGVKPLYYYLNGNGIVFASETKAILISGIYESKLLDLQSFHEFLYYGNALGGRTLFKGIRQLLPGHYLIVDGKSFIEVPYWIPGDDTRLERKSDEDPKVVVRNLIEAAVKRQLVSDVPVGLFLSGGIDSSCIAAFASKHYDKRLKTYSVGFDFDMGINELPKAKMVANHFGTEHTELFVTTENLPYLVERLIYFHDEPFSDAANIPLWLLTQEVKGHIKVVLQGDGGDELFGGYNRYNLLSNYHFYKRFSNIVYNATSIVRSKNGDRISRFANAFRQQDEALTMALLLTVETDYNSPTNVLTNELKEKISRFDPFMYYKMQNDLFKDKDIVQRMLYTDMRIILPSTFLEKVDKSTMANGVEARVPLLDIELAKYVLSLPSSLKIKKGEKKALLKASLRGVVPDFVLDGPKTGFGVPYSNWLKGPLYEFFNDCMNSKDIRSLEIFDFHKIDSMMKDFRSGKSDNGFLLWKLMNFVVWQKIYKVDVGE